MRVEIWKGVDGWPYSVSDMGRVRSDRTGRIMAQGKDKDGYFRVHFCYKMKKKYVRVHRLMMETFFTDGRLEQIDHINQDHQDNRLENLRWATALTNTNNRSNSRTVDVDGVPTPIAEAWGNSEIVGYYTFRERVTKFGWTVEEAKNTPARKYTKKLAT